MLEAPPAQEQVSAEPERAAPALASSRAAAPVSARTPSPLTASNAIWLQRSVGNRAVARIATAMRSPSELARCGCQGPCSCNGHEQHEDASVGAALAGAAAERRLQRLGWPVIASGVASVATGGAASSESASRGDPAQAPATGGAPNPANCSVRVEATKIAALGGLPVWHLSIVHTDETGIETGWRGGPGGAGGAPPYGTIRGDTGLYQPGWVDYDRSAPSVTVGTGALVCGKTACFESERLRINGTATQYTPTGPNSNTWAKTVLANCGLPARKPVWIAPGWGDPGL